MGTTSYKKFYGREQLSLLRPFDAANAITNNKEWAKGVIVSLSYSAGYTAYNLSMFPSSGLNNFLIDGRNANVAVPHDMKRFNQKRFDVAYNHYEPHFEMLATLYLLFGHEDTEKMKIVFKHFVDCVQDKTLNEIPSDYLKSIYEEYKTKLLNDNDNDNDNETTKQQNNKTTEMEMETPTLNIALTICEGNDENTMATIAQRIAASIKNNGKTLYNGNDEEMQVPVIMQTKELHPRYADRPEAFGGWNNAKKVIMIDGAKCGRDQFHDLAKQHLDSKTFQAWRDQAGDPEFNNKGIVAVHVDDNDGSWYEYISTKAN